MRSKINNLKIILYLKTIKEIERGHRKASLKILCTIYLLESFTGGKFFGKETAPETGRFLSDECFLYLLFLISGAARIDGTNRYTYCGNNPINRTDPSGLMTFGVSHMLHKIREWASNHQNNNNSSSSSGGNHGHNNNQPLATVDNHIENTHTPLETVEYGPNEPGYIGTENWSGNGNETQHGHNNRPLLTVDKDTTQEEFINTINQNGDGFYQITTPVIFNATHTIVMGVYTEDNEKLFYATELRGNTTSSNTSAALCSGMNGQKYNLIEFQGKFDKDGIGDLFERLNKNANLYSPIASSNGYNMSNVVNRMQNRRTVWNNNKPTYHAFDYFSGPNSNTYGNDLSEYALQRRIGRLDGAHGQNNYVWRPGGMLW